METGSLEGSFETRLNTFGFSSLHEISSMGEAEMQATWEDSPVPFKESGAASWEEENGWTTVVLSGLVDDDSSETYVMPYFSFEGKSVSEGDSIPIDLTSMNAGLLYTEPALNYEPVQAAWMLGGSLDIDEFEPVNGGVFSGSFSTSLYAWQEVTSVDK